MFSVKNEVLFGWLSQVNSTQNKENCLVEMIKNKNCNLTEASLSKIRRKLSKVFLPRVKDGMKHCNYRKLQFEKMHEKFLQNDFTVDLNIDEIGEECNKNVVKKVIRQRTKSLSYADSCKRAQQKRVKTVSESYAYEELVKAAALQKKKQNIDEVPNGHRKTREIIQARDVDLAAYMNGNFSKRSWTSTRRYNKVITRSYQWPSYKRIRALKETCYPPRNSIKVTSSGASVNVQALFDHTAERIFSVIDDRKKKSLKGKYLTLNFKAGMDGSSNQREYQQIFNENDQENDQENNLTGAFDEIDNDVSYMDVDENSSDSDESADELENDECFSDDSDNSLSDIDGNLECDNNNIEDVLIANRQARMINFSSIFIVSCVPLRLFLSEKLSFWSNPDSSSIRFCRPIMFEFMKENLENMTKTFRFYSDSFDNLTPKKIPVGDGFVTIKYTVDFTMIDGKTCNALSGQKASSNCNICNASPTEMNHLENIEKKRQEDKFKTEFYKFGMSTLHCKMRFMEALLNIAYHLPFQRNRCTKAYSEEKKNRKTEIQQKLKDSIGILVDVVKQGFGTTNSGNTARRFFDPKNRCKVASILNIDIDLITRLSIILEVISSDKKIKIDLFKEYCEKTAKLWVQLYPWKYMTPTVHKVLIHGPDIVRELGSNIGRFSEEAQEANNKIFRETRANKSRGISAIACNTDVILYLLVSSDVVISTERRKLCSTDRKKSHHTKEALKMLHKVSLLK